MGLDTRLSVTRTPPPEVMARLIEKFNEDYAELRGRYDLRYRYPQMLPDGTIETLWRYYSPKYPRGEWPQIRRMIEWLQNHTEGDVLYGHDCDPEDYWELVTPERMAEYQAFWDEHDKDLYEDEFDRWVNETWRER